MGENRGHDNGQQEAAALQGTAGGREEALQGGGGGRQRHHAAPSHEPCMDPRIKKGQRHWNRALHQKELEWNALRWGSSQKSLLFELSARTEVLGCHTAVNQEWLRWSKASSACRDGAQPLGQPPTACLEIHREIRGRINSILFKQNFGHRAEFSLTCASSSAGKGNSVCAGR